MLTRDSTGTWLPWLELHEVCRHAAALSLVAWACVACIHMLSNDRDPVFSQGH